MRESEGSGSYGSCHSKKNKVKSLTRVRVLVTPMDSWSRLLGPWDFPGTTTGEGTFFICKMETTWYLPHTIGCWKDQMKRSSEPFSIDT